MNRCEKCNSSEVKIIDYYEFHDVVECNNCDHLKCLAIEECCRNPHEIYVYQFVDGVPKFIRHQCINCGGCLNMTKPLSFKKYSPNVREKSGFSRDRLNEWKNKKTKERQEIYEIQRNVRYKETRHYKYITHLQSDYWKKIRKEVLLRDGNLCQKCLNTDATEVHHLAYENLGSEKLEDLMSVCSPCHEKIHK